MSEVIQSLNELRRPRLLVRAARLGASLYRRDRDLAAALGGEPSHRQTLSSLLSLEESIESIRRRGNGAYSPEKHIRVLTALIAEAQIFNRLQPG
ncbi:DUF6477 family protein [Algicella marina]|uniref:Uncharacterized protein n=1 Tax=Algicella marina TaxID=2683284 RepID=A0A6P1SZ97_9RHOB|nr:DUF6477 family protein [Algicella marina]QHQ34940.1 hypothetical protein GO499_06885 [Algicella marina]